MTKALHFGNVLGEVGALMAGASVGTSESYSIQKLKWQVKALKKKVPSTSRQEGRKAGGEDNNYNIPLAVMNAACKEVGKNAGRMISWMLKGCMQDCKATKHAIKAAKGNEGDKDDDDVGSNEGDNAEEEEEESKSASLSMGQKLKN